MSGREKDSLEKELGILRHLGMRKFKNILFLYERWIWGKDGFTLQNYHLQRNLEPECFMPYIFYNSAIHVTALFFCLVFLILGRQSCVFIVLCLVLAAANIYCLLLQRYSYLRIKRICLIRQRRVAKKFRSEEEQNERLRRSILSSEEMKLLEKLLKSSGPCLINEQETESLEKLAGLFPLLPVGNSMACHPVSDMNWEEYRKTAKNFASFGSAAEKAAMAIYKRLYPENYRRIFCRPLFICCNSRCRKALLRLLGKGGADSSLRLLQLSLIPLKEVGDDA